MIDPLEYMYGGDTAVAAIQYSFLPSWMSFIADKAPAQGGGARPVRRGVRAVAAAARRAPAQARGLRREPRVVRRRERVQRHRRHQGPHRGRAVGRPDEQQHPVEPVHRRPRPRIAAVAAGLRGRRARCASSPRRQSSPRGARPGPSRGRCTCRTPRTRSSGGPGTWRSTSRTGCAEPTPPGVSRRPCTGTRSSRSGRSPPTWRWRRRCPPGTATPTACTRARPPGRASSRRPAGPPPSPSGLAS